MRGALHGVKVLDLSRYIAGPFCAMLLGDMGADVVKVESPGGEPGRHTGPRFDGQSLYTSWFNRNKRAMTLDTRNAAGIEVLELLVREADVLVENFRPGTLDAMGLGGDRLDELNPDLIVVSLSGFGQTGPYRNNVAFDSIAQAMSGLMWANGTDETGPAMVGTFIADHVTGLYGAIGALTALYEKQRSGTGQIVDVSLLDATFSMLGVAIPTFVTTGEEMARAGNRDQMVAPSKLFETCDGFAYISGGNDVMFGRLIEATGLEDLRRPEFATLPQRLERVKELDDIVDPWVKARTTAEIVKILEPFGIPCGPVASVADAVGNEQLTSREMVQQIDRPGKPSYVVPGFVVKLSKSPSEVRLTPPELGEHTFEVVADWCGLDGKELTDLADRGAFERSTEKLGERR